MLDPKLIPTPLVTSGTRTPVEIVPATEPRYRTIYILLSLLKLVWSLGKLRLRRPLTAQDYAQGLRLQFEHMGGLWVKAGQLIALRRDLFGDAFSQELSKLQDKSTGFPYETVRQTIREDLGRELEQFFDEFEEAPIAAASIGQTHRARLRDGTRVAVKIQRPFIELSFRRDLFFIGAISHFCDALHLAPYIRWADMLSELKQVLKEELDYRIEASSIRRMRKNLKKHKVYAPTVFAGYCGKRVLVMEFVEGVFMKEWLEAFHNDPARLAVWMKENNVEAGKVGKALYFSLLRQFFEDNLFHGDLHPGNIMLLRDSRVALIDFGTIGSLEEGYKTKYGMFTLALSQKEYTKATDLLLQLAISVPEMEVSELKGKTVRILRQWETRAATRDYPYELKSIASVMGELAQLLMHYKISLEWAFMRIDRTHLTLDASLMYLQPTANYQKLMGRYFRKAEARRMKAMLKPVTAGRALRNAIYMATDLPEDLSQKLVYLDDIIRKKVLSFEAGVSKVGTFFASLLGLVAIGAVTAEVLLIGHLLRDYKPQWARWIPDAILAVIDQLPKSSSGVFLTVLALIVLIHLRARSYKKRLLAKEIRPQTR